MLPSEHPSSDHRNCIGMQRLTMLSTLRQKVTELHKEGYPADADRKLDEMTELQAVWDNERD